MDAPSSDFYYALAIVGLVLRELRGLGSRIDGLRADIIELVAPLVSPEVAQRARDRLELARRRGKARVGRVYAEGTDDEGQLVEHGLERAEERLGREQNPETARVPGQLHESATVPPVSAVSPVPGANVNGNPDTPLTARRTHR